MSSVEFEAANVCALLSAPRIGPYRAATKNPDEALALYTWGANTAAAMFELIGHVEVLLRNVLDKCLDEYFNEHRGGIPWFLLPTPGGQNVTDSVNAARERLRAQGQETRDQVVASLSFGFWSGLLGRKYDELWKVALHRAFPNSSGRRAEVAMKVERLRKLRNRLAHHDSMLNVDVPFEVRQIIELASYIDNDAAMWLQQSSRAMTTYAERPVAVDDTVVVAARFAWPVYESQHAYICQAGRSFRPITYLAFYADREIKKEIPKIVHRRDNVEWSHGEVARLQQSADHNDRKIAAVIDSQLGVLRGGRYQVFLLTRAGDSRHRQLGRALPHEGAGRGSAFVQGQRYVSLHALENATSTAGLQ